MLEKKAHRLVVNVTVRAIHRTFIFSERLAVFSQTLPLNQFC